MHLSRSWPTTSARIEAVSLSSLGNQKIVVWYSYKVEGVTYKGVSVDLPYLSADELYEAI